MPTSNAHDRACDCPIPSRASKGWSGNASAVWAAITKTGGHGVVDMVAGIEVLATMDRLCTRPPKHTCLHIMHPQGQHMRHTANPEHNNESHYWSPPFAKSYAAVMHTHHRCTYMPRRGGGVTMPAPLRWALFAAVCGTRAKVAAKGLWNMRVLERRSQGSTVHIPGKWILTPRCQASGGEPVWHLKEEVLCPHRQGHNQPRLEPFSCILNWCMPPPSPAPHEHAMTLPNSMPHDRPPRRPRLETKHREQ